MPLDGYLRFVLALVFVLALIAGLAWLYKRYGQGRRVAAPRRRPGAPLRRLGVVEAVALDSRRRLVLVRRDDREHLIIIGNQGETVVESGIVAVDGLTVDAHRRADLDDYDTPDRFTDPHRDDPEQEPAEYRSQQRRQPASFLRLVRETTRAPS